MAEDGEYEILPHEELEELRKELHKIKRNPLKGYEQADDLKSSIDKLTNAINTMTAMFSSTNDELIENFKKDSIEQRFSQISTQNQQIAQGILAVAKLVENSTKSSTDNTSQKESNSSPAQSNQQPSSPDMDLPNPPLSREQDVFSSHDSSYTSQQQDPSSSSIPPSMEPPMPAGQSQQLSEQAPFSQQQDTLPSHQSQSSSFPDEHHPLNSSNLQNQGPRPSDVPDSLDMDLPPPPPKKKGLLGMFK